MAEIRTSAAGAYASDSYRSVTRFKFLALRKRIPEPLSHGYDTPIFEETKRKKIKD